MMNQKGGQAIKLKTKILKYTLYEIHIELVKEGKYDLATRILEFLRKKKINLWLDDISNDCERILENAGCYMEYSRSGNKATAYLKYRRSNQ